VENADKMQNMSAILLLIETASKTGARWLRHHDISSLLSSK